MSQRSPSAASSRFRAVRNCFPAYLTSDPFTPTAPQTDRVDVEMFGKNGSVELEGLLAQRSLILRSGSVQPGKAVTLDWSPSSDEWPHPLIGSPTGIHFRVGAERGAGALRVRVAKRAAGAPHAFREPGRNGAYRPCKPLPRLFGLHFTASTRRAADRGPSGGRRAAAAVGSRTNGNDVELRVGTRPGARIRCARSVRR